MAKKKIEENEETVDASGEVVLEANAADIPADESLTAVEAAPADEAPVEKKPRKSAKPADSEVDTADPLIIESLFDTVAAAAETVVDTVSAGASALAEVVAGSPEEKPVHKGKRAEKIGVVASDKMTKTVTVRVDRLVKHPVYRKYIRKRKKFMAHDDLGSKIGDKVRIVETRPLSARKRWRVVEIIQKAEL